MTLATKAALYSGLLFPGAGLLVLKRYRLSLVFLLPAALATIYLVNYAMKVAGLISAEVASGQLNIAAITAEVTAAMASENQIFTLVKIAFAICWLSSIVCSYWLGRLDEKSLLTASQSN